MPASDLAQSEAASASLKTFAFSFERTWSTGERTQHTMTVEAFGSEYAQTIFANRQPPELSSYRILDVHVLPPEQMQ